MVGLSTVFFGWYVMMILEKIDNTLFRQFTMLNVYAKQTAVKLHDKETFFTLKQMNKAQIGHKIIFYLIAEKKCN